MVIRLVIDLGELVEAALKREWEKGWVSGGRGRGAAGLCGP
jgi:hypothetical protein